MSEPTSVFPQDPTWPGDGTSRIPFWAYTREDLYKKELDRLFYNGHWCYVGLEAEIPNAGDFRRITRLINGGLNGLEDRLIKWHAVRAVLGLE